MPLPYLFACDKAFGKTTEKSGSKGCKAKAGSEGGVWRSKHVGARQRHRVQSEFSWTSSKVPHLTLTERGKDMIDTAFLCMTAQSIGDESLMYVDVSQCASRAPWTSNGKLKAVTTSSEVWSFGRRRFLLPMELMCALGFDTNMCKVREEARACQKSLVGEAMSWPCVAAATLAILTALPGVWGTDLGDEQQPDST